MSNLLRRLFRRNVPVTSFEDPIVIADTVDRPEFRLGPLNGQMDYSLDWLAWPVALEVTFTMIPGGDVEQEDDAADPAFIDMTGAGPGFPAFMALYNPALKKPWRVLVYDPSSRMYVVVKSFLTELEADAAVTCIANGWPLNDIILPN